MPLVKSSKLSQRRRGKASSTRSSKALTRYISLTHIRVAKELRAIAQHTEHPCFREPLNDCIALKTLYDRAVIARAACEAVGGVWEEYVREFASLDLADCAVLAVDDILDESQRRAGNPTLHTKWGIKTAILIAEVAKSISAQLISIRSDRRHRSAFSVFEGMYRDIQYGQYLDLLYESADISEVTQDAYLEMVRLTTGVQISACCKIGALLGGASEAMAEAAGLYGLHAGTAFQIRDDLIDYLDNEKIIGKPPFLDIIRGKKRIPLLLAWRTGSELDRRKLTMLMCSDTELKSKDRTWLATTITKPQVVERIHQILDSLSDRAHEELNKLPPCKERKYLDDILAIGSEV